MSNQLQPIDQLCQSLANPSIREKLAMALPSNINVDRFIRTAINAIQTHPQIDKLIKSDRRTLFISLQKAASDGLILDGREATLVAFWNKNKNMNDISYIPMVQGLVKTARNSGEVKNIEAHVVYKKDSFQYRPGIDNEPVFDPDWFADDRGEPVGAYATISLKDGEKISAILNKNRIMDIAKGGNNPDQYNPEKGKHWMEWWRKTVIKNALKYAPKSAELIAVLEHDNKVEFPDYQSEQPASAQSILDQINRQQSQQDDEDPMALDHKENELNQIQQSEFEIVDDPQELMAKESAKKQPKLLD